MQDPSSGVAPQLKSHVHLISGHRFPLLPNLTIEQAFRYLLDAPTIVRQTAPMAWNYVSAPQDGTVWLEWIAPQNGQWPCASDGYIWGDPESSYRHEFSGFTIEILVHSVGFRLGLDNHTASHARTRYHFIHKNPSTNAAPPDPNLWIVHYHQAEQGRMLPVAQMQITQPMRAELTARRYLEGQGRLEKKDFMLHDREHWPTITVPGSAQVPPMQQPGMYSANAMLQQQQLAQQRFPQYGGHPPGQGPPVKRQRHSGPSGMPGPSEGAHDTSIEDEENTSLGDFFDHLSPREISMARYMQHHRWMEEVFSSPYASSQIVPPDLGLGLMGELKGLTEGIVDPPSVDEIAKPVERPGKAKEAQLFTNLKKEQVDEFNRRVEKHLQEGHAEIERMKKEHAEKMAEWKRTKTLMQAEKRLRHATWEGHESAVPVYRLDMPQTNGHAADGVSADSIEDVVRDVEGILGVKISSHKDATMIEKGGLEKEEEPLRDEVAHHEETNGGMDFDREMSGMQQQQQQEPMMSGANNNVPQSQPDYHQQLPATSAETKAEALQGTIPADLPQPTFEGDHNEQAENQAHSEFHEAMPDTAAEDSHLHDMEDMHKGNTSLMDMDVDTGDMDDGIEFIEHTPGEEAADVAASSNVPGLSADLITEQEIQPPVEQSSAAPATAATLVTSHMAATVTLREAGVQEAPAPAPADFQQDQPPVSALPSAEEILAVEASLDTTATIPGDGSLDDTTLADLGDHNTNVPSPINSGGMEDAGVNRPPLTEEDFRIPELDRHDMAADHTAGIFDDGTFDDLANMDDGAGDDGLFDFDSAFDNTLPGTGTGRPEGGDGADGYPGV